MRVVRHRVMTRRLWMTKPPGYLGGFFFEREAERGNEFPERPEEAA
jgi:hypothetical protein